MMLAFNGAAQSSAVAIDPRTGAATVKSIEWWYWAISGYECYACGGGSKHLDYGERDCVRVRWQVATALIDIDVTRTE